MSQQILIISSEFPPGPGGIGQHAYCMAKGFYSHGITPTVLSVADYAAKEEVSAFDAQQPFAVIRYEGKGGVLKYLKRVQSTLHTIKTHNFKHVILTGKFSLWQGWFIKLFFSQVQTLAILHGSEINLPDRLLRWFTHFCIAKADVLIPVSRFTASLLPAKIRNGRSNMHIIPNGIEINTTGDGAELKHHTLPGSPALLTVGHISPRKGQHRVIRALPDIIRRYPQVHYHMVGRPVDKEKLMQLTKSMGASDYITIHGRVEQHTDLAGYYKGADVFMLLSENQPNGDVEGFGIVALEANQYGLPVVGARGSGVEEAVANDQSGLLVDGNDPAGITAGIAWCLDHRQQLKEGAISWANEHKWSEIIIQYLPLLR